MPYKKKTSDDQPAVTAADLAGEPTKDETTKTPVDESTSDATQSSEPQKVEAKTEEAAPTSNFQPQQPRNNYSNDYNNPRVEQAYAVSGYLEIQPEGHGFLRPKFIPSARDIYISQSQIRRFMLRSGREVS